MAIDAHQYGGRDEHFLFHQQLRGADFLLQSALLILLSGLDLDVEHAVSVCQQTATPQVSK